jgi:hypothetical protein
VRIAQQEKKPVGHNFINPVLNALKIKNKGGRYAKHII